MEVATHSALSEQPDDAIRWPGVSALPNTFPYRDFAAISIRLFENTSKVDVEGYVKSFTEANCITKDAFDARQYDDDTYPDSTRFFLSRLILREWAHFLHHDRMSIFLSEGSLNKSRVRTYKGLVARDCRSGAHSYNQLEVETGSETSALLARVDVTSTSPPLCLFPLGDTFRAFGVFDSTEPSEGESLMSRVSASYGEQQSIWRWQMSNLLPAVCRGPASLFFLQGVASETTVQLILYLPAGQLAGHLDLLRVRFGVDLSFCQ